MNEPANLRLTRGRRVTPGAPFPGWPSSAALWGRTLGLPVDARSVGVSSLAPEAPRTGRPEAYPTCGRTTSGGTGSNFPLDALADARVSLSQSAEENC